MSDLRFLILRSLDAPWNLAAEQIVFDCLPKEHSYLLLWQNRRAIIVGKHQDTLAEIDRSYAEQQEIQVVRRLSGGGAVYHDLGNLNYTIITDAQGGAGMDMSVFCRPVLRLLHKLGAPAVLSGRNDLTLNGQKFSGSAQYLRRGRVLHHGTLLFDSDLGAVQKALRVDPEKIRSKGLPSVRSRVTNLRPFLPTELDLPHFRDLLLQEILLERPGEALVLSEKDLAAIDRLREERYARWDWNYGASPPCSLTYRRRFEGCGTVEARIDLDRGCIRTLRFLGDYFSVDEPDELERRLHGVPYTRSAVSAVLREFDVARFFVGLGPEGLTKLLFGPAEDEPPTEQSESC